MDTSIEIFRLLAHRLYDDEQDVVTGTSTGGSTTTLVDALALKYTDADATAYDRRYVYNEASGETAKVDAGGYAATGTITISPANSTFVTDSGTANAAVTTTATTLTDTREAWTVDEWIGYNVTCEAQSLLITSNTTTVLTGVGWSGDGTPTTNKAWEITPKYVITGDRPQVLKNAIADVLRSMYVPSFFPLSLHICTSDDNDMETAPATTFQANAKSAALGDENTIVFNGAQALQVVGSEDGGYVHFGSVNVNDGEPLYAAIMCSAASGATFRIIDVTNSNATVEDATTDEGKYMELTFPFTVPTDCEQIHARAISTTSGAGTDWDDYQIWRSEGVYPGPSWLTRSSQMIDVRAFPRGTSGPASDNDFRSNEQMSIPLRWHIEREDMRGDNPLHLWVAAGSARPYIVALRPLSELSLDSSTTPADKDKVVDLAADLVRDPEKGYKRLRNHVAAVLTAPSTHVLPRVGVSIR